MTILIADKLSSTVGIALQQQGYQTVELPSLKDESLLKALQEHKPEILVIRSTKVRTEHIENCPSLALIIRAGAGVNNIDMDTASKRGVFVANCPGRNAIAVAELAIGHLVNLDRRIADNVAEFNAGRWAKKKFSKANGLYGRKLALFGFGSIGIEVMKRAKSFGMSITVWSVPFSAKEAQALGVQFAATPAEALVDADVLSIHLPLVKETRGLINAELLSNLKDGAYIINTSRGEVIDEEALIEAISTQDLRVGLDVFCNEPGASDQEVSSVLCSNPNVYVTHHIGASTDQATESVGEAVLSIISDWKTKGQVQNCVNLAKSSPADHCLTVRHADEVGVLANVLDALKEMGHNVQEMENIIFQGGSAAVASIQVVGCPSPILLNKLNHLPNVFAASATVIN